jgi:hypothetical protein
VALSTIAFAATIYVLFAVGPYPRWIHVIDALVMICLLGGLACSAASITISSASNPGRAC